MIGFKLCKFHTINKLSLLPLANCVPSKLHFNPQISCLCPKNLLMVVLHLISLLIMEQSFEPLEIILPFHATTPTRSWWELNDEIFLPLLVPNMGLIISQNPQKQSIGIS